MTENATKTDRTDSTVTPYAANGEIDYDRLLEQFGADRLTHEDRRRFPEPVDPLLDRDVYYAHRSIERVFSAIESGDRLSVVTGCGPSGPMHIGHLIPFRMARYLQETAGAHVYIPVSDDEKYYTTDQSFAELHAHARDNLRDVLAMGFDPDLTTIVLDTADADVLYPIAAEIAGQVTTATVEAIYGTPPNPGLGFYPAMQTAHLLLPQLLEGRHPTVVPVAIDQDPHIRLSRDVAATEAFPVSKPAALLSRFLPALTGDGKASSSDDHPTIELTDDPERIRETITTHAYSGGRSSVAEHREHGGDPSVDVAFQLLAALFEPDDAALDRIEREYRSGELLSGTLKQLAADRIVDRLQDHQRRREHLEEDLASALEPYRLTSEEIDRLTTEPLS
jgi:tryptophanyl-tRNA synthetase